MRTLIQEALYRRVLKVRRKSPKSYYNVLDFVQVRQGGSVGHILLLDASPDIHLSVSRTVSSFAKLTWAKSISEANKCLSDSPPDMIILDLTLPDGDGFDFFAKIQASEALSDLPVIFLTNSNEVSHKVHAYSVGAVDYIHKPFHVAEFKARVQAALDRWLRVESKRTIDPTLINCGPLEVNTRFQSASIHGALVDLTKTEYKTLLAILSAKAGVISREEILKIVWNDTEKDIRSVHTHVSKIRKKLGVELIQSVHGAGYRAVALAA
jgi:DNA-binding response OmpR family regulator